MEGGERSFGWDLLVPHVVHPAKVVVIEAIRWIGQPLSATEMTKSVDDDEFPLSTISYHVRKLAEFGAIQPVRQRQVRGSVETFYFFPAWQ